MSKLQLSPDNQFNGMERDDFKQMLIDMGVEVEDCDGKGEIIFDNESEHNPYLDMSDNDFINLLESNEFKVVDGTGKIIGADEIAKIIDKSNVQHSKMLNKLANN